MSKDKNTELEKIKTIKLSAIEYPSLTMLIKEL